MNIAVSPDIAAPLARHTTVPVQVGHVTVGGGAPVVVQSMTNTDTADVESTAEQVAALARAGSEMVRITVDRDEAASAVPHIKERLLRMGVTAPIVGATKLEHVQDALAAEQLELSERELELLQEPYVPHPVLGHF